MPGASLGTGALRVGWRGLPSVVWTGFGSGVRCRDVGVDDGVRAGLVVDNGVGGVCLFGVAGCGEGALSLQCFGLAYWFGLVVT